MKELKLNPNITSQKDVEYVGGGKWEDGISVDQVWSNYFHNGKYNK